MRTLCASPRRPPRDPVVYTGGRAVPRPICCRRVLLQATGASTGSAPRGIHAGVGARRIHGTGDSKVHTERAGWRRTPDVRCLSLGARPPSPPPVLDHYPRHMHLLRSLTPGALLALVSIAPGEPPLSKMDWCLDVGVGHASALVSTFDDIAALSDASGRQIDMRADCLSACCCG